jgi:hypothetical protein
MKVGGEEIEAASPMSITDKGIVSLIPIQQEQVMNAVYY